LGRIILFKGEYTNHVRVYHAGCGGSKSAYGSVHRNYLKVRWRAVALKAAFIFVAPEADAERDQAVVDSPVVHLTVVGVKDYQMAVKAAKELVDQGVGAIELCAGFGVEGAAMVKQAVQGKAAVGVVRFDNHPGFDFKSGDEMFK
jgi:hypothetical protein